MKTVGDATAGTMITYNSMSGICTSSNIEKSDMKAFYAKLRHPDGTICKYEGDSTPAFDTTSYATMTCSMSSAKTSPQVIDYFTEPNKDFKYSVTASSAGSLVMDYNDGFISKDLTDSDFHISECGSAELLF